MPANLTISKTFVDGEILTHTVLNTIFHTEIKTYINTNCYITTDAASAKTASKLALRDASGNCAFATLTVDGITATGNLDIGAYEFRAQTFQSDVTTGTAPLIVASTTMVSNLQAQYATNLYGGGAGQIPYNSAANTSAFLAAGSANQILQCNGTSAPSWTSSPTLGTVTASSFVGPLTGDVAGNVTGNCSGSSGSCTGNAATATTMDGIRVRAYISTGYSHTGGQELHFNAETLDPKNKHNVSTYRTTPALAGTYLVNTKIWSVAGGTLSINVNGSIVARSNAFTYDGGVNYIAQCASLVYLSSDTDYISIKYSGSGVVSGGTIDSYLDIIQVA